MRNNIAFDIDGVVVNLVKPILHILDKHYKIKLNLEDIKTYDIYRHHPDLTPQIIQDVIGKAMSSLKYIEPYPGANNFLNTLYAESLDSLTFYTSRKVETIIHTYRILDWIIAVPYYIHFESNQKIVVADSFDYFVEDRAEIAMNLARLGVKVFVPIRPWNQGLNHPNITYINELEDLKRDVHKFII